MINGEAFEIFEIPRSKKRLQTSRLSGIRTLCSPHPCPLAQGEGASSAVHSTTRAARSCRNAVLGSPLPEGEGRGEGEWALESTDRGSLAFGSQVPKCHGDRTIR